MESIATMIDFILAHPGKIAVCVGFPVALHLLLGGKDGSGGDWFGGDCGGDGGD